MCHLLTGGRFTSDKRSACAVAAGDFVPSRCRSIRTEDATPETPCKICRAGDAVPDVYAAPEMMCRGYAEPRRCRSEYAVPETPCKIFRAGEMFPRCCAGDVAAPARCPCAEDAVQDMPCRRRRAGYMPRRRYRTGYAAPDVSCRRCRVSKMPCAGDTQTGDADLYAAGLLVIKLNRLRTGISSVCIKRPTDGIIAPRFLVRPLRRNTSSGAGMRMCQRADGGRTDGRVGGRTCGRAVSGGSVGVGVADSPSSTDR